MLSIELVPRDSDQLVAEARAVADLFGQFGWLNIPDVKGLPLRSHDAALAAAHLPLRVIPHVRARDRSPRQTVEIFRRLMDGGVTDALIVTGDRFDQDEDAEHPTSLDVLKETQRQGVAINVWAAFDPYRGELRAELEYVKAKMEAGAAGLFTQPFFDGRLAKICLDQLEGIATFVGISPVTSDKSRKYWERTNRVVFPPDFEATLEYCARLTAELVAVAEEYRQHAYLMPIRVDPITYLKASFALIDPALDAGAFLKGS